MEHLHVRSQVGVKAGYCHSRWTISMCGSQWGDRLACVLTDQELLARDIVICVRTL